MATSARATSVPTPPEAFSTLRWVGGTDGLLVLLDQTRLPLEQLEIECRDPATLHEAIRSLRVRGAPAIGVAAAYGVCLGLRDAPASLAACRKRIHETAAYLATSRPTAVNLFWALDRMRRVGDQALDAAGKMGMEAGGSCEPVRARLLAEAKAIEEEDRAMCAAIGRHGAELLSDGQGVLTHCNAGALATAGDGTALSVLYAAHAAGKRLRVFADETRPLLQGARLTAWELQRRGLDVTLLCDSMAAVVMREGRIQAVVVGADRIAANGDVANKIGTYGVAVLAEAHGVPFYVAAPTSTFDLSMASGESIPVEQRDGREIAEGFGRRTAPAGVEIYNPAFDVTPARLIRAIICERGVIQPVTREAIARVVG